MLPLHKSHCCRGSPLGTKSDKSVIEIEVNARAQPALYRAPPTHTPQRVLTLAYACHKVITQLALTSNKCQLTCT